MDSNNLTLGLDLGVTSIGWALADVEGQQIVDAGVRIFEAPMDVAKFEAGEPGGSKAAIRRKSRMQRRQTSRRQARHRDLYLALQSAGMLPFAGKKAEDRHKKLTDFDKDLMSDKTRDDQLAWGWRERIRAEAATIADPDQVICYYLRAKAATEKLELPELGRALYHLGQRRGFKSNRREGRSGLASADAKKEEAERSQIKSSIATLQDELDSSGHTSEILSRQLRLHRKDAYQHIDVDSRAHKNVRSYILLVRCVRESHYVAPSNPFDTATHLIF